MGKSHWKPKWFLEKGNHSARKQGSKDVAWILIGLNDKNLESDIGVNAETWQKESKFSYWIDDHVSRNP